MIRSIFFLALIIAKAIAAPVPPQASALVNHDETFFTDTAACIERTGQTLIPQLHAMDGLLWDTIGRAKRFVTECRKEWVEEKHGPFPEIADIDQTLKVCDDTFADLEMCISLSLVQPSV